VAEGAIALRDGARELFQAFLEMGQGGFRAGTEAGDEFTTMLQEQLQAVTEQGIAMRANGATIQEVRGFQRGQIADIRELATAAGLPAPAIQHLVDLFGTLPRDVLTDIETRGAEESGRRADNVREAVNRIPKFGRVQIEANNRQALLAIDEARRAAEAWARMTYTAQAHIALSGEIPGAAFGRRAAGGPVEHGMPYLVGEEGPELFVPGSGGTIIPNDAATSGGAAVAGGSTELHLHFGDVYGDPEAFARSIAPVVGRELAAIDRGV
jgi:hypothetical protein